MVGANLWLLVVRHSYEAHRKRAARLALQKSHVEDLRFMRHSPENLHLVEAAV